MSFVFLGNAAWLDFVNTVIGAERPVELLRDPADLTRWGKAAGLLRDGEPPADAPALVAALAYRETLRAAARALSDGAEVPAAAVEQTRAWLGLHRIGLVLQRQGAGWRLCEVPENDGPLTLLSRIAADFARFLADVPAPLLRQCGAADCVIYFHDTSKNHTRRWCSMETCGNRAKAAGRRARDFTVA